MQGQPLIIRADASTEIGTGHLMRCLALAQAWKAQGGKAIFITACESDVLRQRIWDEGFEIATLEHPSPHPDDWQRTSEILANYPGAWVVLDGYHFDEEYQLKIKQAGHRLLVIDDMAHLKHYYADIVLNQNIHAEELRYSCEPYTRLLLGTRYVLLRSEFLAWRGWKREIPEVARKVLVTLGGSDPNNVTLKVIKALQRVDLDGLEATVVVGASNPHYQELVQTARESKLKMQIVRNSTNMPELMAWADVAISGGGTTSWELLFMGVPTITLELAKNQQSIAANLGKSRLTLNLGLHTKVSIFEIANELLKLSRDMRLRLEMSRKSRVLVDSLGRERVVECMLREHSEIKR